MSDRFLRALGGFICAATILVTSFAIIGLLRLLHTLGF